MTASELQEELYTLIKPVYPDMQIKVEETDTHIRNLYFIDDQFRGLYALQRYHYLSQLIPADFSNQNLRDTVWFELIPDENPDDIEYHDEKTINEIKDIILSILREKTGYVSALDQKFIAEDVKCFGNFRHSKALLTSLDFSAEDQFDIFHVMMNEGGYCDCEILYNVFRESRYAKNYWLERQK